LQKTELGIASGSGGVFELLKAIKNIGNITIDDEEKPPNAEPVVE
jgi:hypothetical protein